MNMNYCSDGTGRRWRELETMVIENHGGTATVTLLREREAKMLLNQEYGFEVGQIKIEAPCWYEATDWNYFKFSVAGRWKYEVRDFGQLNVIDWSE